jgi:integrase
VAWKVIDVMPCTISLVRVPKQAARFLDFAAYERLMQVAAHDGAMARLIVLLGGDAGLRCGEMMALEWTDLDLSKRQLTVARSDWKGMSRRQREAGSGTCR